MKRILIGLIITALTSCEKQENVPLKTWYLSLDIPALGYDEILPVQHVSDNIGADGKKVGLSLDFSDALLTGRLFTSGGAITQFSGMINGHSFLLVNDSLNICGGLQRVYINLKLENK